MMLPTLLMLPIAAALAQSPEWREAEAPILTGHVQLTHPDDFIKAGEAYFNPDATWIIFQAVPRPIAGQTPDTEYSMYVAKLARDGDGAITGIEEPIRVSAPGSSNTCGYFHPILPHEIIFGSTVTPPADNAPAGYQRDKSRYAWKFPNEMEVTSRQVREIARDRALKVRIPDEATVATPLFERPGGYDAECAYSPDARHIVFSSYRPEEDDADLFVWDSITKRTTRIVSARGYDGGPFFSPDAKRICYRSDRAGNELLQLYVADLAFDPSGAITGIEREYQLTADENVNWAPYWHPDGTHLVFATSRQGHHNYEVYAIDVPALGSTPRGHTIVEPATTTSGVDGRSVPTILCADGRASKRITEASGFDGLPVFSDDASLMMWTSQRGPTRADESRPSSQVWVARVTGTTP